MQSESNEPSTPTPNRTNTEETTNTSQYGFPLHQLQSADHRGSIDHGSVASTDYSSGSSVAGSDNADLRERLRRLSVSERDLNRPKPSFQQISEYENAFSPSPPKRQNEGPGFKIIKRKGGSTDGPQLANFPNEVLTHILSHLPAASLSAVSLVSQLFYNLVTTPHAWRIAFTRFFPGQDAIGSSTTRDFIVEAREQLRSEHRVFTRLTGLASWRSEYILRTRLLRSLARGKPSQITTGRGGSNRSINAANTANAVVTYSSQLFTTVNHIHAVFDNGKKSPRFIHGADETGSACTSDPNIGKIDNWGLADPQSLPQFSELFIGDLPYGEGDGPAGLPNCMDLSQPFGMVYGEGFPGGQTYFRSPDEQRGRFLSQFSAFIDRKLGIPELPRLAEAISAVWIAKTSCVPSMTEALVGVITGSTLGILTTYSLGADTSNGRIPRGQLTSKSVVSPGVPIIALQVDDSFNSRRKSGGRVWAVALNALGEIFYLVDTPSVANFDCRAQDDDSVRQAWRVGRTFYWKLLESSRRIARDDPYNEAKVPGSYSPRPSSDAMLLSEKQTVAETIEIESFLRYQPSHFRKVCEGWDMRQRLEVDFGGDDGNGAGESMFRIKRGVLEGQSAEITRFTRGKTEQAFPEEYPTPKTPPMSSRTPTMASLFGGGTVISPPRPGSPDLLHRAIGSANSPVAIASPPGGQADKRGRDLFEEWRVSNLSLDDITGAEITTTAIDLSVYALLTLDEDPLRTVNGNSNVSSPFGTPSESNPSQTHIPGQRARFLAVGTSTGVVAIWDMRSSGAGLTDKLQPVRSIHTDSPQISCLAMSALYVVVGGNDGLVQAWDPLASSMQPIRTLNSRFSSRARRRLVQAEASIHGVGINLYAAGAIVLDTDPTVLRGMVSLGTHLRYWSYSSSAADQYQSKKRRLRRSRERSSNAGPDRFTNTGRGALMDYIATEQEELKVEKLRRSKEEAKFRERFGVGLGGLSDEEALKYAEMVSAESFQKDERRRLSDTITETAEPVPSSASKNAWGSPTTTIHSSTKASPSKYEPDQEFADDMEEAIRLSLLDGVDEGGRSPKSHGMGGYDIPIYYKAKKVRRSASTSPSTSQVSRNRKTMKSAKGGVPADDLEFALQLSLAEEQSRLGDVPSAGEVQDMFPELENREIEGKGKGRAA